MTRDRIDVWINGAQVKIDPDETLASVAKSYDLPQRGVAIEVSGYVIPRSQWPDKILKPNDKVEIVQMVGGG